jgi:hypothetical protein
MSGSASKLRMPRYDVPSFSTGLNKAIGSYYVRDSDIVEAKNVEINLGGAINPRLGMMRYDDASSVYFSGNQYIRNGHRYSRSDGNAEIIVNSKVLPPATTNNLFADNGTGLFATVSTPSALATSDDDKFRFEQWKDTLYIASENTVLMSYNRGGFGSTTGNMRNADIAGLMSTTSNTMFSITSDTSGDAFFSSFKNYSYRFTVERYHGNEFVGESLPLYDIRVDSNGANRSNFQSLNELVTVQDPIELRKHPSYNPALTVSDFFTDAKFINIYRSIPLEDDPGSEKMDAFYYFLDQLDTADFTGASGGDVLFYDDGSVPVDASKPLIYSRLSRPPQAKFISNHKSRLWFANITGGDYTDGNSKFNPFFLVTLDDTPSRIYFSELLQPESVRLTSFFDVGGSDGEGVSALHSFENKLLIAFKPNSMWGVFGADSENIPGVPDIQISAIDTSVGCIAPESVSYGESGIIFLSNKGVYFYDGTRPVPLRSELIDPILDNITAARKKFAVGQYSQNRKYILSITDNTVDSNENKVALEFDFRTKTWTRKTFGNSTVYGVNGYLEAKRGDEAGKVYAILHTIDSAVGAVQTLGDVQYDIDPNEGVSWSFKTKHFDCGDPDAIKHFRTIIVRLKSSSTVTINYDIDDGCTTGTLSLTPIGCGGATATAHTWDETGLNWLASAGQDTTHVWGGSGGGGGSGAQQNYVINVATAATPNPKGRRIQFEFTGTATTQGQEFQGLTILWTPEQRIGNA